MKTIDEGCNLKQIEKFCNNRKITYYALDYKFKTISTNNGMGFSHSQLPRLVFIINDKHLYPVEDATTRETIFKSSSIIGGGIKKHKVQQKEKTKN